MLEITPPMLQGKSGKLERYKGISIIVDGEELPNVINRTLYMRDDSLIQLTIEQLLMDTKDCVILDANQEPVTVNRSYYLKAMNKMTFEVLGVKF